MLIAKKIRLAYKRKGNRGILTLTSTWRAQAEQVDVTARLIGTEAYYRWELALPRNIPTPLIYSAVLANSSLIPCHLP